MKRRNVNDTIVSTMTTNLYDFVVKNGEFLLVYIVTKKAIN